MVAVIGGGEADGAAEALAEEIGRHVGGRGAVVLTGGRTGVMEAASRGARQAGAPAVIAVLPGYDPAGATPWADVVLPTGLGHARNAVVVASADVVVAVGGGAGTLSEIGLAAKLGRPVVLVAAAGGVAARAGALLPGLHTAEDAAQACALLDALLDGPLSPGDATRPAGP
ncbi:MAG: TIGR00725 family protein [Alphaproteobacteria bacterium]|nr:TIGR00725 family protein [Alphaproteobacteria bacterium]